jgi:hypothetical protein
MEGVGVDLGVKLLNIRAIRDWINGTAEPYTHDL